MKHGRNEKYVPALQLLLSDMDPRDRFLTYQAAFLDNMVFYSMAEVKQFEGHMQTAYNLCIEAKNIADGSSGLGVVVVQRLNSVLQDLDRTISVTAADVGIKLNHPRP